MDFWFDVVCPYAYVASTRIDALASQAGVAARWRPVLLGGVLKGHATEVFPMRAMSEPRQRHTLRDIVRSAAFHDVPLALPADHPRKTVDAMRILAALPAEDVPSVAARLFRAYWVDGADVASREVLRATLPNVDVDALVERGRGPLREATDDAVRRGVFGVPTFGVGDRLDWGVDRLAFVRRALGLPPGTLPATTSGGRPIEVFWDFSSPFAYLGVRALAELAARTGSEIVSTPILLGALFKEIGTADIPLDTFSPARRAWTRRDLHDFAALRGHPFHFATTFPLRTPLPLRVTLLEPRARDPLFAAAWVDDRDIGLREVVALVLAENGLDPGLVDAAGEPGPKQALRDNTARAVALGVPGVPTFRVGDELFWGQDHLDQVEAAARI